MERLFVLRTTIVHTVSLDGQTRFVPAVQQVQQAHQQQVPQFDNNLADKRFGVLNLPAQPREAISSNQLRSAAPSFASISSLGPESIRRSAHFSKEFEETNVIIEEEQVSVQQRQLSREISIANSVIEEVDVARVSREIKREPSVHMPEKLVQEERVSEMSFLSASTAPITRTASAISAAPTQAAPQAPLRMVPALTEDQMARLKQFHHRCLDVLQRVTGSKNIDVTATFRVDEACACRYLKFYSFKIDPALKAFDRGLVWHRDVNPPQKMTAQGLSQILGAGFIYCFGKDRQGKPVIYINPAMDRLPYNNEQDIRIKMNALYYALEKAIQSFQNSKAKMAPNELPWDYSFTFVCNLKTNPLNMKLASMLYGLSMELGDRYPCAQGRCIILNMGWSLNMLWNCAVKPFLTKEALNRFVFINSHFRDNLNKYIDEYNLPADFYGDPKYCNYKFNVNTY